MYSTIELKVAVPDEEDMVSDVETNLAATSFPIYESSEKKNAYVIKRFLQIYVKVIFGQVPNDDSSDDGDQDDGVVNEEAMAAEDMKIRKWGAPLMWP